MKKKNKKTENQICFIPQTDILPNPNQPRKRFDYDELEGLAQSIRSNGILQPLIIRELENGKYELVAGERRLRAARLVGLTKVPCIISEISEADSAVFAVLENLQRQDLDYFEEAEALATLLSEYRLGQEELCRRLGKAQSTVSNKLRLLKAQRRDALSDFAGGTYRTPRESAFGDSRRNGERESAVNNHRQTFNGKRERNAYRPDASEERYAEKTDAQGL